jgi:hypothetical protein
MMTRPGIVVGMLALSAALGAYPVVAAEATHVAVGAGATLPAGTSFGGVDVTGLQIAIGAEISPDGTAGGEFAAVLLGLTIAGEVQPISVQGRVNGGTRSAANVAVVSGTATLDLGNGLPPAPDIPFVATLVRDAATARGTLGLVIAGAELPSATLDEGGVSIQTAPPEPPEELDIATLAGAGP